MLKYLIVLICLLALPISLYGRVADINLPSLIKICESFENAVTDVNMEYDYEVMGPAANPDPSEDAFKEAGPQTYYFVAKKPFEQFYRSRRILRLENKKGKRLQHDVTQTYDGSIFKEHQLASNKMSIGSITNKPASIADDIYICSPLGFTIFKRNGIEPLLDILKGRYDYYTLRLDPNISKVNDFNTVEVACIGNKWKVPNSKALSIYFSVDHNYSIVKIGLYNGPNRSGGPQKMDTVYNVEQLKDLGKGIWFPCKSNIVVDGNTVINTFKVNKVAINEGLTEKSKNFDMEFPPGTRVEDHVTGKTYTIKSTQDGNSPQK